MISAWPKASAKKIRYLLADIDDTITEDGRLPAKSLLAMERLRALGIKILAVTGRPAGWCDHIARMWPVDGIVGENGALSMVYDRQTKSMTTVFARDRETRQSDRQRLDRLAREILQAVPGTALASDQPYRASDLAIDFAEDVEALSSDEVTKIVGLFEAAGAQAKISSIHVNGWFGSFDKLTMSKRLLAERFGIDIDADNKALAYIGDSPNDQPMFEAFQNSIGVANVRDFSLTNPPRWITVGRSADGFCELCARIAESR